MKHSKILILLLLLLQGYVYGQVNGEIKENYEALLMYLSALDKLIPPPLPSRSSTPGSTPTKPLPTPPPPKTPTAKVSSVRPELLNVKNEINTLFSSTVADEPYERALAVQKFLKKLDEQKFSDLSDFLNEYQSGFQKLTNNYRDLQFNVVKQLILYRAILADFKDRFDKNYVYKGWLNVDLARHLATDQLSSDLINSVNIIGNAIKDIKAKIDNKESFETIHYVGNKQFNALSDLWVTIEKDMDNYKAWEGFYPGLSKNVSLLEKSMENALKKELNDLNLILNSHSSLNSDEVVIFKDAFGKLLSLTYRTAERADTVDSKISSYLKMYEAVYGSKLTWSQNFTAFKKYLTGQVRDRRNNLNALKASKSSAQDIRNAFKEYARYVFFTSAKNMQDELEAHLPATASTSSSTTPTAAQKAAQEALQREYEQDFEKFQQWWKTVPGKGRTKDLSSIDKDDLNDWNKKLEDLQKIAESLGEDTASIIQVLQLIRAALK